MNDKGLAKTSIVIPVWDAYAGASLREALRSVRGQERPLRVILVDNASNVPLGQADEGMKLVRAAKRISLGAARNLGLSHVDTPFVIFWDADDVMLPGALAALEDGIEACSERVLFGLAIKESPSGARHRWPRPWLGGLVRFPRVLAVLHCIWAQFPTTGATIIRAEAARAGGGFADAESGEDWCLGVSLAFRGRIGWSEQFGRIYRLYPESVWARHLTVAHQREHARAVRHRIREDPAVPGWARGLSAPIWLAQYAALTAHALVVAVRSRAGGSG
jgi:glycosyltransferase involved in cell wall biosynthesis